MADWLEVLLVLVAWYGLQVLLLPRLGVPT